MAEWRSGVWARAVGTLALALVGSACAPRAPVDEGVTIRFEDRAEPEVFERTGAAMRDRREGAAGLWAAVPGLPRPERAEIVNLDTGKTATVALFRSGGTTIRVSNEAADLLGIGAGAVPVRVTALRSVPEIGYNPR